MHKTPLPHFYGKLFGCILASLAIPICLGALTGISLAQSPPPSSAPSSLLIFPPGVTLQTASNGELSTAVKAAIFKNPDQAPQIVSQSVAALAIGGRLVPQKIPAIARGANVTAVLVKKGQKVKTGQILAVLDVQGKKMKYTATADGVISSLGVSPDLTRLDSDSLALIAQSPECSTTAIRYAILAGFLASPTSITQIVEAAVTAAPSFSDVIIKTAQEAAPDQSDAIAKAAMKAMPPAQATAASASPSPSPLDTNNVIALEQPESGLSPAELDAEHAFNRLKQSGGLSDPKNVQEAVKHVMARHTVTSEIPAPLGAKIIAIYKKNGEIVHTGDKLLTLRLPDGREVPVLAQQDGIMQEIHVSKGGIIGNTRPRSARNEPDTRYDVISVTLRTI